VTRDDRLAALLALTTWMLLTILATWLVMVVADIYVNRPAVTKDPYTGQLHIPRSNLTVGERRRRHRL